MKPITKPLLFAALSFALMSASCKKTDFPPPDPFATLDNSLVCKINGSEWRSNENTYSGFYDLNPFVDKRYLYLHFRNGTQSIYFYINSPYRTGIVNLNSNTSSFPNNNSPSDYASFFNRYPDLTPPDEYITNEFDTGVVDFILMDTISKKIKAKFSFNAKDSRTGKKINVTNGYFEYHQ